jgi:hypoxanthine phosphoribosyltransferase
MTFSMGKLLTDTNLLLTIISTFVTVVSIITSIYYYKKSNKLEKEKLKLEWNEIRTVVDDLTENLKKTGFKPDIILAPGLRGAIISEILIENFNREIPVFVGVSHIHNPSNNKLDIETFKKIKVRNHWNIYIPEVVFTHSNNKILIVDDFCLTGSFFNDLKEQLIENGFNQSNIKIFCSVITNVTKLSDSCPDFYWKIVPDDNFYFPWGRANRG